MGIKLKTLSSTEVIKIFISFGFSKIRQNGSHIKLRHYSSNGLETLIIPNHKQIPKGTLKAIYNPALKYIHEVDLKEHFYSR